MASPEVTIVGGGLAGAEAALALARRRVRVTLCEMRPARMTPAHSTGLLAELVCSNSLKGTDPMTAHGILKREMSAMGSIILEAALATRVPAGKALAVDRLAFAGYITESLVSHPLITVRHEEVSEIDPERLTIVATGPLTSDAMAGRLACLTGSEGLYFYDAISPIVDAGSIDMDHAFFSSRWDGSSEDYLNCPLDEAGYTRFVQEILEADSVRAHTFEDARHFEACLPVEVLAGRGLDALRFGPMRPVGLTDPRTGRRPHAVVQLRRENLSGDAYTMVGFQTRLTYPEQRRVISLIPALRHADFLRYGSVHRNTYVDSPRVLETDLSLKCRRNTFLAGQITGVEGYVESAATGIFAGLSACARLKGACLEPPGPATALGALMGYITLPPRGRFQPMNINFGVMQAVQAPRARRAEIISARAHESFAMWLEHAGGILGETP
jgi:methylenetetrahydrofolate--tRNA-(uracil-5-)-methyltransferase